MSIPEGRAVWNGSTWDYEFDYRDIYGNLRVSFKNDGGQLTKTQSSDYDALGFEYNKLSQTKTNYYKYQNQERVEDFGLNIDFFKYRPSDNQLGRFWQIDPLASDYPYNSPYAFQENKFGLGVELEGLEFFPFPAIFTAEPIIVRPIIEPIIEPVVRPIIEPIIETPVRTAGGKPKWDSNLTKEENIQQIQRTGREAHTERQAEWKKEGFETEVSLNKASRADGIKIEEIPGGQKTGIIRKLKPDSKNGRIAGPEQLSRYIEAASKKFPDVKIWKPELELYRSATPIDATKVTRPIIVKTVY
jgi:hypothetical protein